MKYGRILVLMKKRDTPLKAMYGALLEWLKAHDWEYSDVVIYQLADGQFLFSQIDVIETIMTVTEEAGLSDRLLLVICSAYLEDQFRLLLARFLIDDKLVEEMFDRSSASFMYNLGYTLGLITKDWHDMLRSISQLRNTFAHRPEISSFEVLLEREPKWQSTLNNMQTWTEEEKTLLPREVIIKVFMRLYALLQFSIDHVAAVGQRKRLDPSIVVGHYLTRGITREFLESFLDGNWISFSDEE